MRQACRTEIAIMTDVALDEFQEASVGRWGETAVSQTQIRVQSHIDHQGDGGGVGGLLGNSP